MRRMLAAALAAALLMAACGGDDDLDASGTGAQDALDTDAATNEQPVGADDTDLPEALTGDPDGAVADFPIPSPPGAVDAIATEFDGIQAAQVWFDADRYDEVVGWYEAWFLDNGLIATPVERVIDGQVVMGGADDTGSYTAIIITDGDRVFAQLSVE